jgi:hypothetical protein
MFTDAVISLANSKFTDPPTNIRQQIFQTPSYGLFFFCEVQLFGKGLGFLTA